MTSPSRSDWLRVITFNTWKGDGNYSRRLQLTALQLQQLAPDIICLQEALATADGCMDTARFLAQALAMNYVFAPARRKNRLIGNRRHDCESGLAVLSVHSIHNHGVAILPALAEDPERIAQTVLLQTSMKQRIVMTNLHLTHVPGRDEMRMRQLASVLHAPETVYPSVLSLCCGDFNYELDEEQLYLLRTTCQQQITDCYPAGRGAPPGDTFITAPLGNGRRIDYILALTDIGAPIPICANSRIVLNTPDSEGTFPSDHFGVMVDLYLGHI